MKNVDFSPSVFDDRKAESLQPASFNWTPWIASSVLILASGGLAVYVMSTKSGVMSEHVALSPVFHSPSERGVISAVPLSIARTVDSATQKENCTGEEIICTVATASKPVELLRKLISAIPDSTAKQYRVRLSVTAIDEPASDNTADSSTP